MNKYDKLRLEVYDAYASNKITESERDDLICEVVSEEFFAEVCDYVIETKEDWENFLKEHHYDTKTRTIKINGRTVHIETRTSENFGTDKTTSKIEDKYIKKYGDNAKYDRNHRVKSQVDDLVKKRTDIAMFGPVFGKTVKSSSIETNKSKSGKIYGIIVNLPEIYKLNKREINMAVKHEVGHLDDFSARRRADSAKDFIMQTPYNKIPKELIEDFKKSRHILTLAERGTPVPEKDVDFVNQTFNKIQKATGAKRNKDDEEAYDYSDVEAASFKKALLKRGIFDHTNNPQEIRADMYAKAKDPSIDIENDLHFPFKSENRVRKQNVDELLGDEEIKKKAEKYMK